MSAFGAGPSDVKHRSIYVGDCEMGANVDVRLGTLF